MLLTYVASCFGRKEGFDPSVRVMITKSHDKKTEETTAKNGSTLSLECPGLVSSSTMQRTVTEDTKVRRGTCLPRAVSNY